MADDTIGGRLVTCGSVVVILLLISDHGIVIDAGDPRIDGMTVVTSIGLKYVDLVVITPAANSSAGEVVTLETDKDGTVVTSIALEPRVTVAVPGDSLLLEPSVEVCCCSGPIVVVEVELISARKVVDASVAASRALVS